MYVCVYIYIYMFFFGLNKVKTHCYAGKAADRKLYMSCWFNSPRFLVTLPKNWWVNKLALIKAVVGDEDSQGTLKGQGLVLQVCLACGMAPTRCVCHEQSSDLLSDEWQKRIKFYINTYMYIIFIVIINFHIYIYIYICTYPSIIPKYSMEYWATFSTNK